MHIHETSSAAPAVKRPAGHVQRRARVMDWNQTAADYPKHLTVPQLFEAQAQRTPHGIAVICGERSLSYRELDRASNRLAHELRSRGAGRGSHVGICLPRSPELLVALLAVLKSGAAYVPLDPAYPAARLAQIVDDARPAVLLTDRTVCDCLPLSVASILLFDAEAKTIALQPDTPLDSSATSEDLAYVIYTSGSTGRPKGVQIPHRALTNLLWSMRRTPGITAGDTMVSVTTISFDLSVPDLFLPLIVGAKLVLAKEDESGNSPALRELLRHHRATIMQATPVTWQILLAAGWRPDQGFKMLCGGEALQRPLAEQLLQGGGELWNMYGPTETTVWSSALRVEPGAGPVLIGPPIANTQFYVLDPQGQLAPSGTSGELYIGGDGVALGYLNLPELTQERFVPDPYSGRASAKMYRTGDRVRLRQHGTIEFMGRLDHQIKLRGFRIELGEIETALRAHPEVSDGVVVVRTDASGEDALQAYVVATGAAQPESLIASLRAKLRQTLPWYMCPSAITVLDALPRLPNGKLDRAALPVPAPVPENAHAPERALSEVERQLTKIWSEVLGIPAVAIDANFFEVGGHSLLAVRLLARIEAEFGRTLSLATLFKNLTITQQARLLEQAERNGPRDFDFRQVVKLQPNGARPPLIAINNTGIYYALSKRLGSAQPFTSLQLFDPSLPSAPLPRTLEDIAAGYAQLIRRVQATGPYSLLGWCVAGTLAFEVARQLTAAGEKVLHLILFDTLTPGYPRRLPWLKARLADYSYRWQLITADWTRLKSSMPKRAAISAFLANRTSVKKMLRLLGRTEKDHEPLLQGQPRSPEQYDRWLLQYLEDAAASYLPKRYSGNLTLFRSSQEPAGRFLDPQMGWGIFADKVEVVVVAGDHFSIFQEPRVSQIAQRISSAVNLDMP